jgi:hypothetical protein
MRSGRPSEPLQSCASGCILNAITELKFERASVGCRPSSSAAYRLTGFSSSVLWCRVGRCGFGGAAGTCLPPEFSGAAPDHYGGLGARYD